MTELTTSETFFIGHLGATTVPPDSGWDFLFTAHLVSESVHASVPHHMPASIPADEAYYWSRRWQMAERDSLEDLSAGRYRDFDDPREAVRHLLSGDR